jgi:hypothetical protein
MPASPTHPTLGEFYLADVRRLTSPELDLGLWWRTMSFNGPRFRAAYVVATGEIYVMQHEGLPGGGRVEVIAHRRTIAEVLDDLDGMEVVCGDRGSLRWLLDRLAPAHADLFEEAPATVAA